MGNTRFTLNVPNGLGERVLEEANKTGRSKQGQWCYMAECYFSEKKEVTADGRLILLCGGMAFVCGTMGILVVWLSLA